MSWMSSAKASELLTAVQLNPEIGSDDASFVTDVIQRAARFITQAVGLERYPHNAQGYSISGSSASTDISNENTNALLVSVDGDDFWEILLALGSLTTGSAIASALQTAIRNIGVEAYKFVTVTHDSGAGTYTITSPTYGESSAVNISYDDEYEDLCVALKLGPVYGGTEYPGATGGDTFDLTVIRLVTFWYNQVGVEGMRSYSIPGEGSYTSDDIPPDVKMFIMNNRRFPV